jgi:hypothetical protein
MSGLSIGQTDKLDHMPQRTPFRRGPAGLDVGIIRMRPNHDDSKRLLNHAILS